MVLGILLAALSGCSKRAPVPAEGAAQKPPVEVSIPQAFVKQGILHVRATVKPLVNIKADQITIGLIGIRSGQLSMEETRVLSQLAGRPIAEAEKTILADFEVKAEGLTEYQVVCKWGADADAARGSLASAPIQAGSVVSPVVRPKGEEEIADGVALADVVLRREPIACRQPPCDESCAFEAELRNGTAMPLRNISLALGVLFVPAGSSAPTVAPLAPLQADEQEVRLEGLEIPAKSAKSIEVKIDQPLVELPDGTFVPRLRLLQYKQ